MSICFITAIYGSYEHSCKKFVSQTVSTKFICFTDNKDIAANGWTVDTTPYHYLCKSRLDDGKMTNSICNNQHTFNIAKYYKQSFRSIPVLQDFDVIVWIDGTIEIIYEKTSEYILQHIYKEKVIGWHHEHRRGILYNEVMASNFFRYTSTFWNNQKQPFQDVNRQYKCYIEDEKYVESFWDKYKHITPHFGVWITCFVAFLQKDSSVIEFLDLWYLQTLKHTTQDQISFPYVCQKTNLIPFTLPNPDISGEYPHHKTLFYNKHEHGQ